MVHGVGGAAGYERDVQVGRPLYQGTIDMGRDNVDNLMKGSVAREQYNIQRICCRGARLDVFPYQLPSVVLVSRGLCAHDGMG